LSREKSNLTNRSLKSALLKIVTIFQKLREITASNSSSPTKTMYTKISRDCNQRVTWT